MKDMLGTEIKLRDTLIEIRGQSDWDKTISIVDGFTKTLIITNKGKCGNRNCIVITAEQGELYLSGLEEHRRQWRINIDDHLTSIPRS
jgi:hypothetical protein